MDLRYVNGKAMKENSNNLDDEYYTKPEVARKCFETTKKVISQYESIENYTWLEPSAGLCNFYNLLPKARRIGVDINPINSEIIKSDYLKYKIPNQKTIVIGNPPFGHRGVLALEFINHSNSAEYVAFILPMFFMSKGKGSARYRVKGLNLIHEEVLEGNAFYLKNGSDAVVKCCFQIWSKNIKKENKEFSWYNNKGKEPFSDLFVLKTVSLAKKRECGLEWIYDKKADYYLSSTFFRPIKAEDSFSKVLYKSGIAIVLTTKDEKLALKIDEIIKKADWSKYSSVATNGCHHLGKSHIYQLFYDEIGEEFL